VELLLVKQTSIGLSNEEDARRFHSEYLKEKAGLFGLSKRETYRVVFVWIGVDEGLADKNGKGNENRKGTNLNVSSASDFALSASDKKTCILVGSAAVRQCQKMGDPVKILNIQLFNQLFAMLDHGFGHGFEGKVDKDREKLDNDGYSWPRSGHWRIICTRITFERVS
jgi:hypothetical protein